MLDAISGSASRRILRRLDLSGAQNVSLPGLALLSQRCEQLEELSLRQCSFETDSSFSVSTDMNDDEAENSETRAENRVARRKAESKIVDPFLDSINVDGFSFPELSSLDVSETEIIPETLVHLLQVTPHLRVLNISRCQRLRGPKSNTLVAEIEKKTSLRILDASFCFGLSLQSYKHLDLFVAVGNHRNVDSMSIHAKLSVFEDIFAESVSNKLVPVIPVVFPMECGPQLWYQITSVARDTQSNIVGVKFCVNAADELKTLKSRHSSSVIDANGDGRASETPSKHSKVIESDGDGSDYSDCSSGAESDAESEDESDDAEPHELSVTDFEISCFVHLPYSRWIPKPSPASVCDSFAGCMTIPRIEFLEGSKLMDPYVSTVTLRQVRASRSPILSLFSLNDVDLR